ncbi:MAG: DUF992 domain-containing protein [Rhodobacteraceae bacterium]|nr:DUF992 domain-containing protein [Paracoccaceae bacterium]
MKRFLSLAIALSSTALIAVPANAETSEAGVKVGKLTCAVEEETNFIIGSNATLDCIFEDANGSNVSYSGTVSDFGLDIGTTKSATLVWGVLAPTTDVASDALEGTYGGVTAGASLGAGVKANALIGGFDKSIALNPVSVESQQGTNLTLGVSKLTLKASM